MAGAIVVASAFRAAALSIMFVDVPEACLIIDGFSLSFRNMTCLPQKDLDFYTFLGEFGKTVDMLTTKYLE